MHSGIIITVKNEFTMEQILEHIVDQLEPYVGGW